MNNKALILLAVQATALLTPTLAICETECATSTKDPAADFTINYSGRCTPATFLTEVTNTATQACLICLYNAMTGLSETDISAVVTNLCLEGYADDVFPYAEISRKGAQFDNEHYAGGGEWNYEIETASGEDRLAVDAARVDDIYYYEAQRKVIEFPEYIESFNPHNPDTVINSIQDLDGCDLNAAYCCFAQDRQAGDNNGNCATPYEYNCVDKDPADNANICYVDHTRSSKSSHVDSGFSIYVQGGKENIEGPVHCHGFTWPDNDPLHQDSILKGNLLFYVSMYDHMTQRGYVRNIPGSPMCACAENMAVVTRADCTETSTTEKTTFAWNATTASLEASIDITDVNFNACQGLNNRNNDLEARARQLEAQNKLSSDKVAALQEVLVGKEEGKCAAAVDSFLGTKGITKI